MKFDKAIYDEYCSRGLVAGIGNEEGSVCIEAAFSLAAGYGFQDRPSCVNGDLNDLLINMNDSNWYTDTDRSEGLYKLGLAQLNTVHLTNNSLRVAVGNKLVDRIALKLLSVALDQNTELLSSLRYRIVYRDFETIIEEIKCSNLPDYLKDRLTEFFDALDGVYYELENAMSTMLCYKHIMNTHDVGLTHEQVMKELSDIVLESLVDLGHTNELAEYWK